MVKQAPTLGRLLTMVVFATSCFGLLLFLWLAFGGATPLKPKGYQFRVVFPEATQLAQEADVRVAGVAVGKVRKKELAPGGNATLATVEIDRRYAPLSADARAVLRQKSLLGETYVELTTGTRGAPKIPEGGLLDRRNVQETVELDEILNALDPFTRKAFRTWQQSLAQGVNRRGPDLNDAFGSLPGFVDSGGDLLEVLDGERANLRGLIRNTGVVFGALTRREDQLRALIENSDTTFGAIAREREAFADTWQIFPTFLDESRATFRRLQTFSRETRPLVRDLQPALDDLTPTLQAVNRFSPDLRRFFTDFDPLIDASKESLPATSEVLDGLRPLLAEFGPWAGEVNPILDWIAQHQHTLTDVMANLGVATHARTTSRDPRGTGHYLRQFGPTGAETAAVFPTRLSSNRGNAYIHPLSLVGPEVARRGIIAAFDCRNTGAPDPGDKPSTEGPNGTPACETQKPYEWNGKLQRFPNVVAESYARP